MDLIIKKIILWPKDRSLERQELDFYPDKINIITGLSETGKSSITYIIDYCLGSGKCAIPSGIIRSKTDWFGLLLELKDEFLLVAGREPGERNSSTDCYLERMKDIKIPETIEKTDTVDSLKEHFNQLAWLPSVKIAEDKESGYKIERPSFRDLASFNFLPQHIVANPYTLFYKADSSDHREKLINIFPLVLGAKDAKVLLAEEIGTISNGDYGLLNWKNKNVKRLMLIKITGFRTSRPRKRHWFNASDIL